MLPAIVDRIRSDTASRIDCPVFPLLEFGYFPERNQFLMQFARSLSAEEKEEVRGVVSEYFDSVRETEPWHFEEETMGLWV